MRAGVERQSREVHPVLESYIPGVRRVACWRQAWTRACCCCSWAAPSGTSPGRGRSVPAELRRALKPGDSLLLGADLVKPVEQLLEAYDDPTGVTAAFNLNLLAPGQSRTGADFDLRAFRQRRATTPASSASRCTCGRLTSQTVNVPAQPNAAVHFAAGETIWTESSHKYRTPAIGADGEHSGLPSRSQLDRPGVALCRDAVDRPVIVEYRAVTYRIGGRTILDDLNLAFQEGETLVLLGRSGSGKTTALKMVNGLIFPSSGQVLVNGKATSEWDPIRLRRSIGYVIQDVGLFPHFTVKQNVDLVPKLEKWDQPRIDARTSALLSEVGLSAAEHGARFPRQLSGGQRQRVGVARALAADPQLLLFDEPFGALDPVTRLELQKQFLELRNTLHKTSLFVTHDVREALKLGTRIALLHEGKLAELATPEDFRRSEHPEARAFLACLNDLICDRD